MEVRIKGEVYDYVSDFPAGWKFSKGDHFKFPVVIGPAKCFIKRFDKHTDNITGWKLLEQLAGETEDEYQPLAKVHDTVSVIENNRIVHYVFFEYVAGQTLYDCISEKTGLNLHVLTEDLFAAILMLQKNDHWFPDFVEKNIFYNEKGRFLLVDLDSTYPTSDLPDNEMWGSKDYWILVVNFYKTLLNYNDVQPADFNGASFNCLHGVFLILRLTVFYTDVAAEYDFLYDRLPGQLNNISPSFRDVFTKVYRRSAQSLTPAEIEEIKELVLKKIIRLNVDLDSNTITEAPEPDKYPVPNTPHPVINTFEITNYIEKTGDKYVVANGETFELSWEVQNAAVTELYRNDKPYRKIDSQQKHVDITEALFDGPSKRIKYTLVAINGDIKTERSLIADVVFQKATKPDLPFVLRINDFSIRGITKNKRDTYTLESGQHFTLQWDVENASKVELYRNGKKLDKAFNKGENSIEVEESLLDSAEKLIEYTLIVSNSSIRQELIEQASLKIRIIRQSEVLKREDNAEKKTEENEVIADPGIISGGGTGIRNTLIVTGSLIVLLLIILLVRNKYTGEVPVVRTDHKDTAKTRQADTIAIQQQVIVPETASTTDITVIVHDHLYYDSIGDVYSRSGEYREAIKSYDSAIQRNAGYNEAYYNRGMAKYKLRDYNRAITDFTKTIELNPDDPNAYYQRGLSAKAAGKTDNACNDFKKSCNLGNANGCKQYEQLCKTPVNPVNAFEEAIRYNASGRSKERSGDYRGAIEDYTKAIQSDAKQSLYYRNRGKAKAALFNYKGAIEDYTRAIQLEPNYPDVYYQRGLAALAIYNRTGACADFQKSCTLGDKDGCEAYKKNCR